MRLNFQVADVAKPLLAVKRIVEKGNHVVLGLGKEDNFIINRDTKDKLMLFPNGRGSYVMRVNFVGGGATEVTADSGAEESVCPCGLGATIWV
eukprot:11386426-Karenia_brevis.AAC.1